MAHKKFLLCQKVLSRKKIKVRKFQFECILHSKGFKKIDCVVESPAGSNKVKNKSKKIFFPVQQ